MEESNHRQSKNSDIKINQGNEQFQTFHAAQRCQSTSRAQSAKSGAQIIAVRDKWHLTSKIKTLRDKTCHLIASDPISVL